MKKLFALMILFLISSLASCSSYSEEHWKAFKQGGIKAFLDGCCEEIVLRGSSNTTDSR